MQKNCNMQYVNLLICVIIFVYIFGGHPIVDNAARMSSWMTNILYIISSQLLDIFSLSTFSFINIIVNAN